MWVRTLQPHHDSLCLRFFYFFLPMLYLPYFKPELGGPAVLGVWILPCSGKGFEVYKKWRRQYIPEGSERLLREPWGAGAGRWRDNCTNPRVR